MIDRSKYNARCAYLIPDGSTCLCAATESEFIKDHIRFCPLDCAKFKKKKDLKEIEDDDDMTSEGGR